MADQLSALYQDLLTGSYDCTDRIVLNAYYPLGHTAGGFHVWWERLTGTDETLDNTHLMRMAGRFSRRVRAYAKANGIPLIACGAGERKHEIAEQHLKTTTSTQGVFLILVGRAQAPVWEVTRRKHLERKKPLPDVNHYSFHILDPDWGHLTIKMSGHPPFPAQVILNGHEYVACQAQKAGIGFTKEGNCFTHISDARGLAAIADTLSEESAIGRLSQVAERWIYSACLCFALDSQEQQRSGFRYEYSVYQAEYSRNLLFEIGDRMDQMFQALMDRSRSRLDLKTIKTILGYKHRPKYRDRKGRSAEWEVAIERPTYDLTIFKLHCGRLTLKIYTKGERVLRVEVVVHNTDELGCGRVLMKFPHIVRELKRILECFLDALSCIDQCFIAADTLDQLTQPATIGNTKVGGIDWNKARIRWVAHSVLALSPLPAGFTASQLAARVRCLNGQQPAEYGPRHAAYDIRKLRAKQMIRRIGKTQRYAAVPEGIKALAALVLIRDKVIQPLLAYAVHAHPSRSTQNPTTLDRRYEVLRADMRGLFHEIGLAA
jgi:hypothetical protein